MKRLFSFCSLLILAGAAMFAGCQQDPSSSGVQNTMPLSAHGNTADAHPAWVFESFSRTPQHIWKNISVSDVDGSDLTPIYTSSVTDNRTLFATWSATGSSISFVEMPGLVANGWYGGSVWGTYAIKAVDVSVSNGVVSSSNTRTVYSVTTSNQKKILSQAWCPSTSGRGADSIAFLVISSSTASIYLIRTSGGTPRLIYSVNLTDGRIGGNSLTWSSDGTKIAFVQASGTSVADADMVFSIKIIDLDGTVQTTLLEGSKQLAELNWSNAGTNHQGEITYEGADTHTPAITDYYEAVVNVSSGAATKLLTGGAGLYGYGMYWSPDNSEVSYISANAAVYRMNLASGVSTQVTNATHTGDWK